MIHRHLSHLQGHHMTLLPQHHQGHHTALLPQHMDLMGHMVAHLRILTIRTAPLTNGEALHRGTQLK